MMRRHSWLLAVWIAVGVPAAGEIPLNREWSFSEERARELQEETAEALNLPIEYRLSMSDDAEIVFVLIPAGEFEMGTTWERIRHLIHGEVNHVEQDRIRRELGPRRVRITRPFYLGKYEITRSQWFAVMGHSRDEDRIKAHQEDLPVTVSWADICEGGGFLDNINQADHSLPFEDAVFRLPTEAEWEYACRSGTTGDYAGTGVLEDMGWFADNSGDNLHPIGRKRPNAWGLHDMHGNVAEWCSDRYMFGYSSPMLGSWIDPTGPKPQAYTRIVRGGSWKSKARECRSASRESHFWRRSIRQDIGFRLVMAILPPQVIETEHRPSAGIDPESTDTVHYECDHVTYIGTPVAIDRLKHAERLLYRDGRNREYRAIWNEALRHLKIVPSDFWVVPEVPSAQVAIGEFPGEEAVSILRSQIRAMSNRHDHCQETLITYLKEILPHWHDYPGESMILLELADRHADDLEKSVMFYKRVTQCRKLSDAYDHAGQRAWQEITRYYEAREEYAKAIEALNNWVIREWCGTGAASSQSRRWSWNLQLRVKLREDVPALKQEVWESLTRGRVGASDDMINAIMILYDHKLEDLMVDAKEALTAVEERGGDERHKGMVRQSVMRLINTVSLSMRLAGPEWRMSGEEARKRQQDEALRYGLPVKKSVAIQDEMMEFVLIPAGEFLIGSPPGESGRINPDENQDRVRISRPFYMATYEVMQAQWQAVMSVNPSPFKHAEDGRHPVDSASWNDIVKRFIPLIQPFAPDGMRFDLPTEAQWEYACRAGTGTAFHVGDQLTAALANINPGVSLDFRGATMPVGSYPANAWGLHDMHGNVSEWVKDMFGHVYYRSHNDIAVDPKNTSGTHRVIRGGSCLTRAELSRCASRSLRSAPMDSPDMTGFRLVLIQQDATIAVDEAITEFLYNGGALPRAVKGYDLTVVPAIEGLLLDPPSLTGEESDEWVESWNERMAQLRMVLATLYRYHADSFWSSRINEVPAQVDLASSAMLFASMLPIDELRQRLAQTARDRRLEVILRILFHHRLRETMQLSDGVYGTGSTHWVKELSQYDADQVLALCNRLWTVELEAPVLNGAYFWTIRAERAEGGRAQNVIEISINRGVNHSRIVHLCVFQEAAFNRDGLHLLRSWQGRMRHGTRNWITPSPAALMYLSPDE